MDKTEKLPRIAIVNPDKCKPSKCGLECKKNCPVNIMGKMCIEVTKSSKTAIISEIQCISCGICVKKCPYDAIQIINLPKDLSKDIVHQYGPNSFRLHKLPIPRPNQVLGLVGTNGIGKSTALKILSGKMQPNLGIYDKSSNVNWNDVLLHFRGSELQAYFTKLIEDKLVAIIKPQYVDQIPKMFDDIVINMMNTKNQNNNLNEICSYLDLDVIKERHVKTLSGGELQRLAIGMMCIQNADIYLFDEPSSFLDIKQRLNAALVIRNLINPQVEQKYVIVVEHDLSVLDYLSDYICVLWGTPSAYGSCSMPFGTREAINIFLSGYIPTENLRFREDQISFKVSDNIDREDIKIHRRYEYPDMTKTQGEFKLSIEKGSFTDSEIIVLLGENGTGKTTFIKLLSGQLKADNNIQVPEMKVSYKPQHINPTKHCTVQNLLYEKLGTSWLHPQFQTDVVKPMMIKELLDHDVKTLSGGELQRVAIVLALGKPADIYLIDEPSAYLDSEQRIITAKVIKRFVLHSKKTAFIVEHDFIMATYLADRVVVYSGVPSLNCVASEPKSLLIGMNTFLEQLGITFRRDNESYRPRINKHLSQMDQEQKLSGNYFHNDV